MTITLPDGMKAEVKARAKEVGAASVEDYVLRLIQDDAVGEVTPEDLGYTPEELEAILQKSLDSGPPIPVTPAFWENLRQEVAARLDAKAQHS